jgi:hypothetical protein
MAETKQAEKPAHAAKFWHVEHDAVGPVTLGWTRGRLIAPDDLHREGQPESHLTDQQFERLRRLGAVRPATEDEVKAYRAARKKADDDDQPFDSFFVGSDPVGGVQPVTPEEAEIKREQEARIK